jgi:acyl carrier protein
MNDLADKVTSALSELCREHSLFSGAILPKHRLVEDLGLDSLLLVDLIVFLEERTGLTDIPVLEWAENQATRKEDRFTVRSLVSAIEAHAGCATHRQTDTRSATGRP